MIPGKFFTQALPHSKEFFSVNDIYVSSSGSKNFMQASSGFLEKFVFYMGRIATTKLPNLCTTTACR